MAENLLRNGDFSELWSYDDPLCHRALAIVKGVIEPRDVGNIFTPPGWLTWFVHKPGVWDQPEVRDAWENVDPRRVRSSPKATVLFTFYRDHDAGFLQTVQVAPGRRYRLTAYGQAWSNHDDIEGGHPDDPFWSDGAGKRVIAWPIGDIPYEGLPQAQEDAKPNFLFRVGIDPTGGTNATSSGVLWGDGWCIYNDYSQQVSVEFEATGPTATVFLRSNTLWPFKHNDAYWDDAMLIPIDPPPPPREFGRTYVLLPNMNPFDPAEQARISALNPGLTVGPSADDAAIGHPFLTKTTIVCYQPETWGGKAALEDFWRKYYDFPQPGDVLEYREDHEPPPPNPWLLGQRDPEWAAIGFGDGNCNLTIGQSGCFITCLAMAERFYGINPSSMPPSIDIRLGSQGYNGCVANWRGQPDLYADVLGLRISEGHSDISAEVHMANGGCCLAEMLPVSREHFVFVYEDTETGAYIALDPWPGEHGEQREFDLAEAQSWRIVEKVQPPPHDQPARVGPHIQRTVGDPTGYVVATGGPIKYLEGIENIINVKRARPDAFCVWRQWVETQPIANPNKDAMMVGYVDRFRDSMEHVCAVLAADGFEPPFFGVEGFNETYACWADSIPDAIECDRSLIRALAGYPVAPIVFTAAVGNIQLPSEDPNGSAWPHLAILAHETEEAEGYFGLHTYWFANPNETGLVAHWPWLAGRWVEFDAYLVSQGAHVGWFFGETGAVGGHANPGGGYTLNANAGWRHPSCYAGNWSRYLDDLVTFDALVKEWNDSHGNRSQGGTIFTTTGGGYGWDTFEIGPAEMQSLANELS